MTEAQWNIFIKGCKDLYYRRSRVQSADIPKLTPAEELIFKGIIENHVAGMKDQRKQLIICRRFGLCGIAKESQKSVGRELGITGSRVGQLESKALLELFRLVHPKWRTLINQ